MKTTTIVLFLAFPLLSNLSAQKEASHWFFGDKLGLKFTETAVQVLLQDSKMTAGKGVVTMSDADGELLFYGSFGTENLFSNTYDGGIYNRHHQLMPNGSFTGGEIVHQGGAAFPVNGSQGQYYLVYLVQNPDIPNSYTLQWGKIDMALDNGLGDLSERDQYLGDYLLPGLSVTRAADGDGYWLATRRYVSSLGFLEFICSFDIYRADANGIQLHSVFADSSASYYHFLKFSPNGKYMHHAGKVYDFDPVAGEITGYRTVDSLGFLFVPESNNAEFSPDSRFLYSYYMGSSAYCLRQYDLNASNLFQSLVVLEGEGTIDDCSGDIKGGIQLAIDGKIYISNAFSQQLSVIEKPNLAGPACAYSVKSIQTLKFPMWDFPNFSTEIFAGESPSSAFAPSSIAFAQVWPTLVDDRVFVELGEPQSLRAHVALFDATGRRTREMIASGNLTEWDLSGLPAGMYFIQIITGSGQVQGVRIYKR